MYQAEQAGVGNKSIALKNCRNVILRDFSILKGGHFGLLLTGVLAWQRKWPAAVFCLICLVIPLCAGMASMLRFVVALSPIMLAAMSLLARWRWLFAVSLIAFVAADYFFTVGWLREWLALV